MTEQLQCDFLRTAVTQCSAACNKFNPCAQSSSCKLPPALTRAICACVPSRAQQTAVAVAELNVAHAGGESSSSAAAKSISIEQYPGLDELGWGSMEGQQQF